jgi:hypothetical protein
MEIDMCKTCTDYSQWTCQESKTKRLKLWLQTQKEEMNSLPVNSFQQNFTNMYDSTYSLLVSKSQTKKNRIINQV